MTTFREQFQFLEDNLPPFVAYYQARKYPRGPWAGATLIAQRSGLTPRTVTRMGSRISWKGLELDVICAFLDACGFRPAGSYGFVSLNKMRSYMRWARTTNKPFHHLDQRAWKQFNRESKRFMEARQKTGII